MAFISPNKSTIVRIRSTAIRGGFRLAERTAPAIGARAAERLWFRLPADRRRTASSWGTPFEVRAQEFRVRGRRWGAGPVVYLVHGWGGYAAQLDEFVPPLVEQGFTVVVFDAPSHGQSGPGPSGPQRSHAVEFGKALDAVAARFGPAHMVVAHSMGALAALLTLKHGWLSAERLTLVAPMSNLDQYLVQFAAMVDFGPHTRAALDARVHRRVGLPVAEFDLQRLAGQVERPPLLVVHDQGDRETAYEASVALVDSWPGARLKTTSGLGHRRLLRDPAVVRAVSEFAATDAQMQVA